MQIVTDRGMDVSPEQMEGLHIHLVPLTLTLEAKTYRGGVEKVHGTYVQLGQVLHGHNAAGAAMLRERLEQLFKCTFLPTGSIAPVLGAHTGPGLVGLAFAPMSTFPEMP